MLLMYGERNGLDSFLKKTKEDVYVVNFSSPCEGFPQLDILPRVRFNLDDSQEFDVAFANYIFSDDYRFKQFFSMIFPLYAGENVYILTSKTEFYDMLNESLMKIIQQRYGYIFNEVNNEDDIDYLKSGSFSIQGLYNLDIDKERYISI